MLARRLKTRDGRTERDGALICRDAARFSSLGGLAVMRWALSAPLVVIGLTELPNSGWAKAHPAHPLAASHNIVLSIRITTIFDSLNK